MRFERGGRLMRFERGVRLIVAILFKLSSLLMRFENGGGMIEIGGGGMINNGGGRQTDFAT